MEDVIGVRGNNVVKAQKHYDKALDNLAKGKYDKVIKEFRKAFKDAWKVLG